MDIWKYKMADTDKAAKPSLLSLAWLEHLCQDSHLDTSNTQICPLVIILSTVVE